MVNNTFVKRLLLINKHLCKVLPLLLLASSRTYRETQSGSQLQARQWTFHKESSHLHLLLVLLLLDWHLNSEIQQNMSSLENLHPFTSIIHKILFSSENLWYIIDVWTLSSWVLQNINRGFSVLVINIFFANVSFKFSL